jgi:hypothetical protein
MIWREFEEAAPALAALGRLRFEATHVALLGTLRSDGSPRISPVEPYLVADRLLFGLLQSSRKARDLGRDARCTVHSSVTDVNGSEGEFKLFGRGELVTDPGLLGAYDAWWTADGASPSDVFSMSIESAAHVGWDIQQEHMTVMRWDPSSGLTERTLDY